MNLEDLLSGQSGGQQQNNPQKDSPLKSLKVDLDFYNESLKEVSNDILEAGVSEYPIFIAHQHEVKIGEMILNRDELNTNWTIHVSTLEDFIEKGVINEDRKDYFIKQYKDPTDYMCLFVIVPEGANFIYYPYS